MKIGLQFDEKGEEEKKKRKTKTQSVDRH